MAGFKGLDAIDVENQRVLVRVDLNVPMQDGKVSDATRIERLIPTIDALTKRNAKVILMSHFGRPKGGPEAKSSLRQLVTPLSRALGGKQVAFADDCVGPEAEKVVGALNPGEIALLENLRFHPEEEKNDPTFAKKLAALGDIYVNDAFSVSHRAHASTEALARLLPNAAGLLMQAELEALAKALEHPVRPVAALVGGSKVSTKLDLLNSLMGKVDRLIIGGAMANTLLLARGIEVGSSLVEREMLNTARGILEAAKKANCDIVLPVDGVVAAKLAPNMPTKTVSIDAVPEEMAILDIGPQSVKLVIDTLSLCKTLVWNGPVGAFETAPFDAGTTSIAQAAAELVSEGKLVAVAGGGDTVAALSHAGVIDRLTYVSTAGGAFLEWLEGRELPGVAALSS